MHSKFKHFTKKWANRFCSSDCWLLLFALSIIWNSSETNGKR